MSYLGDVNAINATINTGHFGGTTNINSLPLVNIIQSGDISNLGILLAGTGTGGGPTDNANGFSLALSYNSSTNRQILFGNSSYIGTSKGVLRIISEGGRPDDRSTYFDCCPGDVSGQLPVPFATTIITLDDAGGDCGSSSNRWGAVWAVNGTIQTSAADSKVEKQDSTLGLDFINQLKPKSWKWKEIPLSNIDLDKIHHVFIFEDVIGVAPENFGGIHSSNGDGTDGLNYSSFIAPLVKAVQQLSTKLTSLENALAGQGLL